MSSSHSNSYSFLVFPMALFLMGWHPVRTELARFNWSDYEVNSSVPMENVQISLRQPSADTGAALLIRHDGAARQFVPLWSVNRDKLRDGEWFLNGKAEVAEGTKAGLGIRYYFGEAPPISSWEAPRLENDSWYISRQDWLGPKFLWTELPWYTVPDRAEIGWVFDGPGAVGVEFMRLSAKPIQHMGFGPTTLPVAGAVCVALLGWVAFSLCLASRRVLPKTISAIQLVLSQCFRVAGILGFFWVLLVPGGLASKPDCALFLTGVAGVIVLKVSGYYLAIWGESRALDPTASPQPT